MEENTKNQAVNAGETNGDGTGQTEERTFTQAEVDAMILDRVHKLKGQLADYETLKEKAAKYDEAEEANKTELQKATERADALEKQLNGLKHQDAVTKARMKVSSETNVPVNLLSGDDEDSCREQARAILAFAKPLGYPTVPDSGENKPSGTKSVNTQFAEWFSKAFEK